jgi:hypothetical protein
MLTQRQTAVNTYVEGVQDAYNSFLTTPKPVSKFYQEIDETVGKVVGEVLGAEDAEAAEELYEFTKMDYSNGSFALEITMDREEDTPMPVAPEKIVDALNALSDVQSVSYSGYTFDTKQLTEDEQKEGKPILDDDGNQIGTEDPATDKQLVKIPLTVKMQGEKIDLDTLGNAKEAN